MISKKETSQLSPEEKTFLKNSDSLESVKQPSAGSPEKSPESRLLSQKSQLQLTLSKGSPIKVPKVAKLENTISTESLIKDPSQILKLRRDDLSTLSDESSLQSSFDDNPSVKKKHFEIVDRNKAYAFAMNPSSLARIYINKKP